MLFLLSIFYIQYKVNILENFQSVDFIMNKIQEHLFWVFISVILVFFNWGLEAYKWQISVKNIQDISFKSAITGVLSGLNLALFLPQSFGDYAGRIGQLTVENRADALSNVFLCHISQLIITCLMGLIGIIGFYFEGIYFDISFLTYYGFVTFLLLIVTCFAMFIFKVEIKTYLKNNKYTQKYYHYLKSVLEINYQTISTILLLSFARYLCFLTQFVIMLIIFGLPVNVKLIVFGITIVFLLKSVVPSFNFVADLGIREAAALFVFGYLGNPSLNIIIVSASLVVWFINIFIPSILGTITIYSLKISTDDKRSF